MEILVLGTGCAKCETLLKNVHQALEATGTSATVRKISDIKEIMNYRILMTPGLVIDGAVKTAGRVPKPEEICTLLTEAAGV
ncbi:MAG: thioredoxin family protein [Acidobacteria bacterium]|nr:thioredoxin family protein [Acidobacteriota bacterium]